MRAHLVVLPTPRFDQHLRVDSVLEPLHAEALVSKFPVEALVRSILPRLARIDERRFDSLVCEPAQNRPRDELRAVVGSEVSRCTAFAHQLRQHLDHAARTDASTDIDRRTFTRELVQDRQALQRLSIRARVEHEVVGQTWLAPPGASGRGLPVAMRRRGLRRGTWSPARRQIRCARSVLMRIPRRSRNTRILRYPKRGY